MIGKWGCTCYLGVHNGVHTFLFSFALFFGRRASAASAGQGPEQPAAPSAMSSDHGAGREPDDRGSDSGIGASARDANRGTANPAPAAGSDAPQAAPAASAAAVLQETQASAAEHTAEDGSGEHEEGEEDEDSIGRPESGRKRRRRNRASGSGSIEGEDNDGQHNRSMPHAEHGPEDEPTPSEADENVREIRVAVNGSRQPNTLVLPRDATLARVFVEIIHSQQSHPYGIPKVGGRGGGEVRGGDGHSRVCLQQHPTNTRDTLVPARCCAQSPPSPIHT